MKTKTERALELNKPRNLNLLLDPKQLEQATRHGDKHGQAVECLRADLDSWWGYLARARAALDGRFTLAEIHALLDILNGWERVYRPLCGAVPAKSSLPLEWEDSCRLEGTDAKWKVDRTVMASKIACLTELEAEALCDLVQRWWETHEEQTDETTSRMFGCKL